MQRIDLTTAGKLAVSKFHDGRTTLRLSRIAIGDGKVDKNSTSIVDMTALTHGVVSYPVAKLEQSGNEITATVAVRQSDLSGDLYVRELGLFAVSNGRELLFAYGVPGRFCDIISCDTEGTTDVSVTVNVGEASAAIVDTTNITKNLVTMGTFEEAKNILQREVNNAVTSVNTAIANLPNTIYRTNGSDQKDVTPELRAYEASGQLLTQVRGIGDGSYALGALLNDLVAKSHTHGTLNVQSSGPGNCNCNCTIQDCKQCTQCQNCSDCHNCTQCKECTDCIECNVLPYPRGMKYIIHYRQDCPDDGCSS